MVIQNTKPTNYPFSGSKCDKLTFLNTTYCPESELENLNDNPESPYKGGRLELLEQTPIADRHITTKDEKYEIK